MSSATVRHLVPVPDQRPDQDDPPAIAPPPATGAGVTPVARVVTLIGAARRTAGPATRGTLAHAWLPVAGTWRAAGGIWRWVVADELKPNLQSKSGEVLAERKRRRVAAFWGAVAAVVGVEQAAIRWPYLTLLAAVVVLVVAGVAERRIRATFTPDAGRKALGKKPGSKAVRRVVAAAKLGKEDTIRIVGPVVRDEGRAWMAVVEPPEGVTYQAAAKKQPELAAAAGAGMSQVAVDPVRGNNGRFVLWCADADPLAGPPAPSPLLSMERFCFWTDRVPLGVDVRGRPVDFSMVERTVLIGGESGGGKSVACADLLCALALDPHFDLHLIDGKQVELIDYEDIAQTLIAAPDPRAFLDFLCEQEEEMNDRYAAMRRARVKALTREIAEDLGYRPKLLHVDELALFTRSDLGKLITEKLRGRVSLGRAAMMLTSAATQRPSAEVVDTDLRDLISIRLAMRCNTDTSSDMILSQGWAKAGYSAKDFDPMQRGAGLLLAEGTTPVAMRTNFLSDQQIRAVLRCAYGLREQAGTLPKSDARPAVRLLRQVLAAMREGDKTPTVEILTSLAGDWSADSLADALRPLNVRPADQWIDGRNQRGYRRADVQVALDRA